MTATRRARMICFLFMTTANGLVGAQTEFSWRELPNSPRRSFRHDDIHFPDANNGWIVNGSGEIYRTSDGGESWELQLNMSGVYFRCVGFASASRGWAGNLGPNCFSPATTDATLLFETFDGGENWTPVVNIPDPKPDGLCGISVVNDMVVYAAGTICGSPGVIKTADGGETWSSIDMSAFADRLVDCYFFSPNSGFVVGGVGDERTTKGVVLFTPDGGSTWQQNYLTVVSPLWGWKISFPTASDGFVSLETPTASGVNRTFFLKTQDGGQTWEEKPFLSLSTFYWEQGLGFATPTKGWIGGDRETYETTDGGDNWQLADFGINLNRVRMLGDTLGYAVGQKVYKYSAAQPVTIDNRGEDAPSAYTLHQNYPNPFNPSTTLSYSLPKRAHVILRIYNVLGKEIRTLLDQQEPTGVHSIVWDGKDNLGRAVSSGVYIYRIDVDSFVEYRKMLLAK